MSNNMIGYVNRFRQFYARAFRQMGKKHGISQLEIDVLLFLRNNPQRNTARDISSIRGFAKSNVSNAVESLKEMGYLTVQEDSDSKRLQRLVLSPEKADVVEELAECQKQVFARALYGLTEEERKLLVGLFQKIDDNMKSYLAETE